MDISQSLSVKQGVSLMLNLNNFRNTAEDVVSTALVSMLAVYGAALAVVQVGMYKILDKLGCSGN